MLIESSKVTNAEVEDIVRRVNAARAGNAPADETLVLVPPNKENGVRWIAACVIDGVRHVIFNL